MKKPLVIAHRGASGHRPENTLSAFQLALEWESDGIELDVHMSKDGHLIVCHDETVNRTTNGTGLIKDLTLKEIKELDAGGWFHSDFSNERIPTLEEVLKVIRNKDLLLNIELKSGPILYEGIEKEVIRQLKAFGLQEQAILSSFNHYSLLEIKRIDKNMKAAILYMEAMVDPWVYAEYIGVEGLHPYFPGVIPPVVADCLRNGLMINPFTVNDEQHLKQLFAMGVTGVITNYPDRAKKMIRELSERS